MMRSSSHALPLGVLTALLLTHFCSGIKWLTLSNSPIASHMNNSQQCKLLPNLVPTQTQLCHTHLEIIKTLAQAAREVKKTCQKTFSDMRWNCSSIEISSHASKYRPDLERGTREAAFVYALSTATVIHSLSRACGLGEIMGCGCAKRPEETPGPDFRWGGCGDNMVFGTPLGTKFVDAPIKVKRSGSHANKLMHLHNSEVGRQVLRKSVVLKCKCHGVSGSCSVRTCWKAFQDLKDIAMDLKSRYLSATKVVHRPMGTRKQLVPKDIDIRPVRDNELVYLHSSPDFCTKNEKLGSVGTQDRQCNKTSVGSDSCDLMCCGRGYNPYTEKLVERCHCKYHWCCYVTCKKCERNVERYVCK